MRGRLRRHRIMQANYSIVETTASGDTRRCRRSLGSDKRHGKLNASPVRGPHLRQKNLSIRTRLKRIRKTLICPGENSHRYKPLS